MDLRLLGVLAVVQCLSAVKNDCPLPDILHGYFVSEQDTFSHNTQLYYACDVGYKPVSMGWWATVTCQNGDWSSRPQCIEEISCFDPKIANANYDKVPFVKNNTKLWIRCSSGYEDKKKHATAHCVNGEWTKLPVCEKEDSWCERPEQTPNAIILNQFEEKFPNNTQLEYVCQAGFELETHSKATCNDGEWDLQPLCRKKRTYNDGNPPETTGDRHYPIFTTIDKCGSPFPINNGDFYVHDRYVKYQCNHWYKLKGNSIVRCANGEWTPIPTCEDDFCKLDTSKYSEMQNKGNVFIKSGTGVKVPCTSKWRVTRTSYAVCIDRQLYLSDCCNKASHLTGFCDQMPLK